MNIRESCLQTGNFIYKPGISLTKQDFHLQRGSLGLQRGFSGYYLPCTCIIGAIWLLFVLICSKKGAETGNLIPTLIFTLVFIIAIYFSMNMANWRLIIEGKNITHINWRGKATHYNFENIKIKVCSNLTIKVYEGNRKVIVIDSNMKNLSSFMSWADAYKIPRI